MSRPANVTPEEVDDLVGLALRIAGRIARRRDMLHYLDDLCGVAQSAVVRAIAGFEPDKAKPDDQEDPATRRQTQLRAYAGVWIAGEVVGAIEAQQGFEHHELPAEDAYRAYGERRPIDHAEDAGRDMVDTLFSVFVEEELFENGEAALLRSEVWEALHREIEKLDPRDRRLTRLRYWDEETWKKVGAALDIDERTARAWDTRIRGRLEDALVTWDRVRPIPLGRRR